MELQSRTGLSEQQQQCYGQQDQGRQLQAPGSSGQAGGEAPQQEGTSVTLLEQPPLPGHAANPEEGGRGHIHML